MSNPADPNVLPTSPTQEGTQPTPSEVEGQRPNSLIGGSSTDPQPQAPGTVNPTTDQENAAAVREALKWEDLEVPQNLQVDEDTQKAFLELLNSDFDPKKFATESLAMHTRLMTSVAEQMTQQWEQTQEQWRQEVAQLPEFRGGQQERALGEVAKLVDKYGNAKLREAFDLTGAGNHPAIIQFLYRIAKEINEEAPVSGQPAVVTQRSREDRLFGKQGG